MDEERQKITIYTDGAAEPNPGPGGYGVVLLMGQHRKELSCGYELTTNNRMELLAVIVSLEVLTKPCSVTVHSDSRYVVDSIVTGAVFRWRDKDWWRTKTKKVKNADLWQRFLTVYEKHTVELKWIPGHKGIPENERCDQLAVEAAYSSNRLPDSGYEFPIIPVGTGQQRTQGSSKISHSEPGKPCRKCGKPLIKKTPKRKKRKSGQSYFYEWYLYCTGCKTMYMVESAKRQYDDPGSMSG